MYEQVNTEIRVAKKCPVCGKRVLDKISPTDGKVEVKCRYCNHVVVIDLSLRVSRQNRYVHYRLANSF